MTAPIGELAVFQELEEGGDWTDGDRAAVSAGLHAALQAERDQLTDFGTVSLGIVYADDDVLATLNKDYRGKEGPTNVLSFASGLLDGTSGPLPEDAPSPLGEILIARETAGREAAAESKPVAHHLSHLAVHGTLHLLGYDHETDEEAEEMEARERTILATMGIPDPYAEPNRPA